MPINENGLYTFEDIAFVNTSLFTEAATHFKKYGYYIDPRIKGTKEYNDHWDREEDRLRNGMTVPGKLVPGQRGEFKIQDVHITGTHYGFLNYARIMRKEDPTDAKAKGLVGQKKIRKILEFPRFLDGQYHYFQAKQYAEEIGKNVIVAKARRKGFSYMEGWDSVSTINLMPHITVLVGAYDYKYITLGDQMMGMAKKYLDFLELHTDFNRGYLKESLDHIKLGYKKSDEGNKEFGYLSQIIAISFMNNPDAAVGKDAYKIKLEECGKFPNLSKALDVTLSTVEDGDSQTGYITMFGTGGTDDANWADFEKIFFDPDKRNCLAFDNIWDDGMKGNSVGFFYPQESGYEPFIDEHGNSDIKGARHAILSKREKQKNASSDGLEYLKYVSQRAMTPKEAFASGGENIFPSAELSDQLNRVLHDKDFKYLHRAGQLIYNDKGKIYFKSNDQLITQGVITHDPILNFPLTDKQDVVGCYVEWVSAFRDKATGEIPKGLYRIWHDPYAHDKDSKEIKIKDSLGVSYVYERVNNMSYGKGDKLVACYVGRPSTVDMYNENLLKLTEYWNAEVMFENDRGDVKGFFGRKKKSHLLADEPDLEWEASLKGKSKRGKGISMNEKRKAKAAIYLRDWLLTPVSTDDFGNVKLNLHYIYDPALLQELLKWNLKGNFDRVSSMLVGMFDMYECMDREIKMPIKHDANDFFNRPLFTNNASSNDWILGSTNF